MQQWRAARQGSACALEELPPWVMGTFSEKSINYRSSGAPWGHCTSSYKVPQPHMRCLHPQRTDVLRRRGAPVALRQRCVRSRHLTNNRTCAPPSAPSLLGEAEAPASRRQKAHRKRIFLLVFPLYTHRDPQRCTSEIQEERLPALKRTPTAQPCHATRCLTTQTQTQKGPKAKQNQQLSGCRVLMVEIGPMENPMTCYVSRRPAA